MKVNITYPRPEKVKRARLMLIAILKWPMFFAGCICLAVNLLIGGKAWSVIVVWSLWCVWSSVVSPSLVEYNRISQFIKLITGSCILLILIDALLSPGWAVVVVPIVCFSGLFISGVLFFTDIRRQRQNMLPMLLLIVVSILCSAVGRLVWQNGTHWPLMVMGYFAIALLAACIFVLRTDFIREIKKRFHTI